MNKQKTMFGVAGLAVLLLLCWFLGWFSFQDPVLAEMERIRDEQFASRHNMTEAEQRENRQAMGAKMQGLPEEQRKQFFESSAPMFMKMFEARIDEFLKKSPEEQLAKMDKRIDEMQARGGGPLGGGRGGPGFGGGPEGGPPTGKQMDEFRKKMLDWTTPEQRAKMDTIFQRFNDRMKERGVTPPGGPRGGFF